MSIRLMSMIWDDGPTVQSERFVLLALADFSNDDGECWPSVGLLAKKTCLTDRGVRKILQRLQEGGWLDVEAGGGRSNCNMYRVKTLNRVQPEPCSAPTINTERGSLNTERGSLNPERGSAEPYRTIKNHLSNSDSADVLGVLMQWVSEPAAKSFIAYRKKTKGKALTLTAAKRLANNLKTIFNAGGDTDDALGMAEERGWSSVEADWYFKAKGTSNGKPTGTSNADPALHAIARAVRNYTA